jgi:MFS family permease
VFALIAVPLQIAEQTRSPLAVGLIGAAELVPTVVSALYGGVIADARDRRRVTLACEALLALLTAVLLLNAVLWHRSWPLYAVVAGVAAVQGVQRPSWAAAVPRLVTPAHVPAAASWTALSSSVTFVVGPVLGGGLVALAGPAACYAVDLASFAASLALLAGVPALPPDGGASERVSLRGVTDALALAWTNRVLVGTYLTDLSVTVLALPIPLYPFLAGALHAPWALGLLYAATGIGMTLAALTSGWLSRARRHARIAVAASAVLGLCTVGVGLAGWVWLAVGLLVLGGIAHGIGDIARATVWNLTIPDRLRGRMAGLELLVGAGGPAVGDLRAGVLGSRVGIGPAIWTGGLACLLVSGLVAASRRLTDPRPTDDVLPR